MEKQLNFQGHSFTSCHNLAQEGCQLSLKEAHEPVTAMHEGNTIEEERFYQMEDINSEKLLEVSFEKSLMVEHESVLGRELERFLESVETYLKRTDKIIIEANLKGLCKKSGMSRCQELVLGLDSQIAYDSKMKLLGYFENYSNLQQIMDFVVKRCPLQIAIQLLQVSEQVLESYLRYVSEGAEQLDLYFLMNLAFQETKKLKNITYLDLSPFASLSEDYRDFMLKYQKFIQVYSVTIVLVIAQFFQNPYFEKQQSPEDSKRLLRQLQVEDDLQMEEQMEVKPHKIIKSSE